MNKKAPLFIFTEGKLYYVVHTEQQINLGHFSCTLPPEPQFLHRTALSLLTFQWFAQHLFSCFHCCHLVFSPSVYEKQSHPKQFSSQCDKVWREMIKWAHPSDVQCFWKGSKESCSILSLPFLILYPRCPPPAICWPGHGYFLFFICSTTTWPFLQHWKVRWLKCKLERFNFKCRMQRETRKQIMKQTFLIGNHY